MLMYSILSPRSWFTPTPQPASFVMVESPARAMRIVPGFLGGIDATALGCGMSGAGRTEVAGPRGKSPVGAVVCARPDKPVAIRQKTASVLIDFFTLSLLQS